MSDCLFCRIVSGEIPADVIARNDRALAFRDLNPVAPVHALVIPLGHHATVAEVAAADPEAAVAMLLLASEVAAADGIAPVDGDAGSGYRLVANSGPAAHQTVFHAHLHVLGGRPMGWPPG
jgi:histidine triad (HIT) family protein